MNERITNLRDLDGLSIKDAKRMPHPVDLTRWEGKYEIDTDLGVFRVIREGSTGDEARRKGSTGGKGDE